MDSIIERAFLQVLQDTLQVTPFRTDYKLSKGYLSNIDIVFQNNTRLRVTFVSSQEFLEVLGKGLFEDSVFDDLELRDLSRELANLTLGLAKVLAIKENVHFNIKIPKVFGYGDFQGTQHHALSFVLKSAICSLYIHN